MQVRVITNPAARQHDVHVDLDQALDYLARHDWQIEVRQTAGRGDATRLAREAAARDYAAVVVVGGDGTINEAANGLVGSEVALGVLPMGTGNVWAAQIGLVPIPTALHRPNLLAAAEQLAGGDTRWVDLGRAGARCFLLWAGAGFDALVTRQIETEAWSMKRRLGPFAYGVAGARAVWSYVGTRATLELDGEELRARILLILVNNIPLYGGMVRVAPGAKLDDGWLDVYVFKGQGVFYTLRHLANIVAGQHLRDPAVIYRRVQHVTLHTADPLPVQIDGEPLGTTPLEFSIAPRALKVLLPANINAALFASPAVSFGV